MGTKNKRNDQKPIQISNAFRQAVEATAEIADGYCQGLQALRANATTVTAENTLHLEGSVDIDACVHNLYPNDSRWDYAIGYEGKSYFLEVHPANTSNVSEMLNKAKWLKKWLQDKALPLKNIAAGENTILGTIGQMQDSTRLPGKQTISTKPYPHRQTVTITDKIKSPGRRSARGPLYTKIFIKVESNGCKQSPYGEAGLHSWGIHGNQPSGYRLQSE